MENVLHRPKLGLALGGGGLLGIAHIGVLKALNLAGIKPDYITGTSMGGIVASAYAAGVDLGELETHVLELSTLRKLVPLFDRGRALSGLVAGRRISGYLRSIIGDLDFADLQLPTTLVSVDLKTGQEVHMNSGPVIDAVRSTISIPGVFEPVPRGPHRLIDGGLMNNVPVDVVREMGADVVLAVDVMPSFIDSAIRPKLITPKFGAVAPDLMQTGLIMIAAMTDLKFKVSPPDVVVRPKIVKGVTFASGFQHMSRIIDSGEREALAQLDEIRAIIAPIQP